MTLNKNMNTEENTLQCDLCQKDFTCLRGGFGQEEDSNDIIGDDSEKEVKL